MWTTSVSHLNAIKTFWEIPGNQTCWNWLEKHKLKVFLKYLCKTTWYLLIPSIQQRLQCLLTAEVQSFELKNVFTKGFLYCFEGQSCKWWLNHQNMRRNLHFFFFYSFKFRGLFCKMTATSIPYLSNTSGFYSCVQTTLSFIK